MAGHGRVPPRRPAERRLGRIPLWLPLAVLVGGAFLLAQKVVAGARARELTTIEPGRSILAPGDGWADPRWEEAIAARLAELEPFAADDRAAIEAVEREIASLPFVEEARAPRVLWPDGLEVEVRLKRISACVRIGDQFLAVADDGTILPGGWAAPPWVEGGYLPVLGPNEGGRDDLRPGDVLREARHQDALSVAISMRAALDREAFDVMGPPLIDATRARLASVEEPGVRLELEGARLVLFGRAPWADAPGELPADRKWSALAKALTELRRGGRDWDLLDVRWDTPEIRWRERPGD